MNYSINYAGFVDLAMLSETERSSSSGISETENCQPAYAVQLLESSADGYCQIAEISNPIGKVRG